MHATHADQKPRVGAEISEVVRYGIEPRSEAGFGQLDARDFAVTTIENGGELPDQTGSGDAHVIGGRDQIGTEQPRQQHHEERHQVGRDSGVDQHLTDGDRNAHIQHASHDARRRLAHLLEEHVFRLARRAAIANPLPHAPRHDSYVTLVSFDAGGEKRPDIAGFVQQFTQFKTAGIADERTGTRSSTGLPVDDADVVARDPNAGVPAVAL